ncbi:MAG: 50S ribosomal protein L29 [Coriobacteriia bacterium]|nr:50S ribosomal protein L29 [Coriobacteriia bacterium]
MKPVEVRGLDEAALETKLKESRGDLFNLRFRLATGQMDDTNKIGRIKKDIARLQTEIRSRQLAAAKSAEN